MFRKIQYSTNAPGTGNSPKNIVTVMKSDMPTPIIRCCFFWVGSVTGVSSVEIVIVMP